MKIFGTKYSEYSINICTYSSLKFTNDNRINSSIVSLSIFTFSVLMASTDTTGFNGTFVGCFMLLKSMAGFFVTVPYAFVALCNDLNDAWFRKR